MGRNDEILESEIPPFSPMLPAQISQERRSHFWTGVVLCIACSIGFFSIGVAVGYLL